jgi:hypothetical protein
MNLPVQWLRLIIINTVILTVETTINWLQ